MFLCCVAFPFCGVADGVFGAFSNLWTAFLSPVDVPHVSWMQGLSGYVFPGDMEHVFTLIIGNSQERSS